MGTSNTYRMLEFGEIACISAKSGDIIQLPFRSGEHQRIAIIIQNTDGHPVFEGQFDLESVKTSLEFEIPKLDNGTYHAWIDVNGEMSIRKFTVDKPTKGMFDWIKKKLT